MSDDPRIEPYPGPAGGWGALKSVSLHLRASRTHARDLPKLASLLTSSPGSCPVMVVIELDDGAQAILALRDTRVEPSDALLGSLEKLFGSELSQRLRELTMDVLGAEGLLGMEDPRADWEGRWQRFWLFSRADTIMGGTSEIQRQVIAHQGLQTSLGRQGQLNTTRAAPHHHQPQRPGSPLGQGRQ